MNDNYNHYDLINIGEKAVIHLRISDDVILEKGDVIEVNSKFYEIVSKFFRSNRRNPDIYCVDFDGYIVKTIEDIPYGKFKSIYWKDN